MAKSQQEIGRIAFRVEGDWWNAYWMPNQHNADGAVHLGAVRVNLAAKGEVKDLFMRTMQEAFAVVVEASIGVRPGMSAPEPAPENERSGLA